MEKLAVYHLLQMGLIRLISGTIFLSDWENTGKKCVLCIFGVHSRMFEPNYDSLFNFFFRNIEVSCGLSVHGV